MTKVRAKSGGGSLGDAHRNEKARGERLKALPKAKDPRVEIQELKESLKSHESGALEKFRKLQDKVVSLVSKQSEPLAYWAELKQQVRDGVLAYDPLFSAPTQDSYERLVRGLDEEFGKLDKIFAANELRKISSVSSFDGKNFKSLVSNPKLVQAAHLLATQFSTVSQLKIFAKNELSKIKSDDFWECVFEFKVSELSLEFRKSIFDWKEGVVSFNYEKAKETLQKEIKKHGKEGFSLERCQYIYQTICYGRSFTEEQKTEIRNMVKDIDLTGELPLLNLQLKSGLMRIEKVTMPSTCKLVGQAYCYQPEFGFHEVDHEFNLWDAKFENDGLVTNLDSDDPRYFGFAQTKAQLRSDLDRSFFESSGYQVETTAKVLSRRYPPRITSQVTCNSFGVLMGSNDNALAVGEGISFEFEHGRDVAKNISKSYACIDEKTRSGAINKRRFLNLDQIEADFVSGKTNWKGLQKMHVFAALHKMQEFGCSQDQKERMAEFLYSILRKLKPDQVPSVFGDITADDYDKYLSQALQVSVSSDKKKITMQGRQFEINEYGTLVSEFYYLTTLSDEEAAGLGKLTNLKHLNLDSLPSLSDAAAAGLGKLTNLKSLRLYSLTRLSDNAAAELGNLENLRVLWLTSLPSLSDAAAAHLGKLTNLTSLRLYSLTSLSGAAAAELGKLTNLEVLRLDSLPSLSDAAAAHLGKLTNLELLRLDSLPSLSVAAAAGLGNLTKLKRLDLDSLTSLSPNQAKALLGCKTLMKVYIEDQTLSRDDLQSIAGVDVETVKASSDDRDSAKGTPVEKTADAETPVEAEKRAFNIEGFVLKVPSTTKLTVQLVKDIYAAVDETRPAGKVTESSVSKIDMDKQSLLPVDLLVYAHLLSLRDFKGVLKESYKSFEKKQKIILKFLLGRVDAQLSSDSETVKITMGEVMIAINDKDLKSVKINGVEYSSEHLEDILLNPEKYPTELSRQYRLEKQKSEGEMKIPTEFKGFNWAQFGLTQYKDYLQRLIQAESRWQKKLKASKLPKAAKGLAQITPVYLLDYMRSKTSRYKSLTSERKLVLYDEYVKIVEDSSYKPNMSSFSKTEKVLLRECQTSLFNGNFNLKVFAYTMQRFKRRIQGHEYLKVYPGRIGFAMYLFHRDGIGNFGKTLDFVLYCQGEITKAKFEAFRRFRTDLRGWHPNWSTLKAVLQKAIYVQGADPKTFLDIPKSPVTPVTSSGEVEATSSSEVKVTSAPAAKPVAPERPKGTDKAAKPEAKEVGKPKVASKSAESVSVNKDKTAITINGTEYKVQSGNLNLKSLTSLTPKAAKELGKLTNLEGLRLDSLTSLIDAAAAELGKLTNLEELVLDSLTSLSDTAAAELGSLTKLEFLRLGSLTSLTPKAAKELGNLENLRFLSLRSLPSLTHKVAKELGKLTNLEKLRLDSLTSLRDNAAAHLVKLTKLKRLDLDSLTSLSDTAAAELGKLTNLEVLKLDSLTSLTPKAAKELGNLENLRVLWLRSLPRLSSSQARALLGCETLRQVAIKDQALLRQDLQKIVRDDAPAAKSVASVRSEGTDEVAKSKAKEVRKPKVASKSVGKPSASPLPVASGSPMPIAPSVEPASTESLDESKDRLKMVKSVAQKFGYLQYSKFLKSYLDYISESESFFSKVFVKDFKWFYKRFYKSGDVKDKKTLLAALANNPELALRMMFLTIRRLEMVTNTGFQKYLKEHPKNFGVALFFIFKFGVKKGSRLLGVLDKPNFQRRRYFKACYKSELDTFQLDLRDAKRLNGTELTQTAAQEVSGLPQLDPTTYPRYFDFAGQNKLDSKGLNPMLKQLMIDVADSLGVSVRRSGSGGIRLTEKDTASSGRHFGDGLDLRIHTKSLRHYVQVNRSKHRQVVQEFTRRVLILAEMRGLHVSVGMANHHKSVQETYYNETKGKYHMYQGGNHFHFDIARGLSLSAQSWNVWSADKKIKGIPKVPWLRKLMSSKTKPVDRKSYLHGLKALPPVEAKPEKEVVTRGTFDEINLQTDYKQLQQVTIDGKKLMVINYANREIAQRLLVLENPGIRSKVISLPGKSFKIAKVSSDPLLKDKGFAGVVFVNNSPRHESRSKAILTHEFLHVFNEYDEMIAQKSPAVEHVYQAALKWPMFTFQGHSRRNIIEEVINYMLVRNDVAANKMDNSKTALMYMTNMGADLESFKLFIEDVKKHTTIPASMKPYCRSWDELIKFVEGLPLAPKNTGDQTSITRDLKAGKTKELNTTKVFVHPPLKSLKGFKLGEQVSELFISADVDAASLKSFLEGTKLKKIVFFDMPSKAVIDVITSIKSQVQLIFHLETKVLYAMKRRSSQKLLVSRFQHLHDKCQNYKSKPKIVTYGFEGDSKWHYSNFNFVASGSTIDYWHADKGLQASSLDVILSGLKASTPETSSKDSESKSTERVSVSKDKTTIKINDKTFNILNGILVLRNLQTLTPRVATALGKMKGLKTLVLPDLKKMSPEAANALGDLKGLKSLHLGYFKDFDMKIVDGLGKIQDLEKLALGITIFSPAVRSLLSKYEKLTYLKLSINLLFYKDAKVLSGRQYLKRLDLPYLQSPFSDQVANEFRKMKKLERLQMDEFSSYSEAFIKALLSLPFLALVKLDGILNKDDLKECVESKCWEKS